MEKTIAEIRKSIKDYFSGSITELLVDKMGTRVNVSLSYLDFIPLREARRWLNDHIERLWTMEVYRGYSEKALAFVQKNVDCNEEERYELAEELFFSHDFRKNHR